MNGLWLPLKSTIWRKWYCGMISSKILHSFLLKKDMNILDDIGVSQGRLKITRGPLPQKKLLFFFLLPENYSSNVLFFFVNMPVNILNTDYIYKRTYNASISNNQSKDFASHYDVYMSRAKLLLPFTYCFLLPLFTYLIAQHKWWTQKEQVCLLTAVLIYLRLMHNDFVWLHCTLLRHHRNVMEFVTYMLSSRSHRFWMRVESRDWWQRDVFSPDMWCFLRLHCF